MNSRGNFFYRVLRENVIGIRVNLSDATNFSRKTSENLSQILKITRLRRFYNNLFITKIIPIDSYRSRDTAPKYHRNSRGIDATRIEEPVHRFQFELAKLP